jgi:hypothetical protein
LYLLAWKKTGVKYVETLIGRRLMKKGDATVC